METKELFESYFTSRGVNPTLYDFDGARLPAWYGNIRLKSDCSILEIGCGYGQNIAAFINSGYNDVMGIDVSKQAVDFCAGKGLHVLFADALSMDSVEDRKFDFILMSHFLEHLPKDRIIPFLRRIKTEFLNSGGKILVQVPNAQSNTGCYWAYEDFTHNFLFTTGSLSFVLREAGFTDIGFVDIDGLSGLKGLHLMVNSFLLWIYKRRYQFWNRVTKSATHAPSPVCFTYEIKCLAQ